MNSRDSLVNRCIAHWARLSRREKLIAVACLATLALFIYLAMGDSEACRQLKNFGEVTDANYGAWIQLKYQCNPAGE